ncbi:MAG TPA: 23S rRNA (adenine(2503)-C(2))-methyltransferase RlmN [Fimbriimonadales bacterium]|nr:23S rRNA (adenine(2503)-C(2))-methyltransferase RlmN [Fimbriimonadales bacterium]
MDSRPALVGMSRLELAELFPGDPLAAVRARQVADWVYKKGAESISEMTDIPAADRRRLEESHVVDDLRIVRERRSSDGVVKLLVDIGDAQAFECVLLPFDDRVSCCISTQVGCAMGCEFCATGLSGFDRNLTPGEIAAQYLLLQRFSERRISHVVYMGMGEPLHNYDSVVKSLHLLNEEVGLSYRHLTVSTVGLVPQIDRLAKERLPIHLAISLHSPLDEVRGPLMPINKRWPVRELMDACRRYAKATGRKITFEYLLIDHVTDRLGQAEALAKLVVGLPCLVNLIPFNYVDTRLGLKRPSNNRVRAFKQALENRGVNVSQRMERGQDIAAACGQLRGEHEGRIRRRGLSELPLSR